MAARLNRKKAETFSEEHCAVRVVQVRRAPTKTPGGVYRRPRIIKEIVSGWYHRCQWCQMWFVPTSRKQRFCDYRCRHSAFRERQRQEMETLRQKARWT